MKKRFLVLILVCIAFNLSSFAQQASIEDLNSALGFESTVNDVPESPINFLIGAFIAVGSILGFRKLKK